MTKIDTTLKTNANGISALITRVATLEALILGGGKKFKPNDQAIRNTITMTPDQDLVFPVVAGKKYGASGVVYYHMGTGASTGIDVKLHFTCPLAPTQFNWAIAGPAVGITSPTNASTSFVSRYQASPVNSSPAQLGAVGETSQAAYCSFWCEPTVDGVVT